MAEILKTNCVNEGMDNDEELFNMVFENFKSKYKSRKLEIEHRMYGNIVKVDGKDKFNTTGYNLLYNLQRLCECLEDELF